MLSWTQPINGNNPPILAIIKRTPIPMNIRLYKIVTNYVTFDWLKNVRYLGELSTSQAVLWSIQEAEQIVTQLETGSILPWELSCTASSRLYYNIQINFYQQVLKVLY